MNDTQNRQNDPNTILPVDSAKSELLGALGGGILGSMGIPALGEYNTYKGGLEAQERLPGLIDQTREMIGRDELDLELVELAHQYRKDPSVLEQFAPHAREGIRKDIDLLERIHERERWDRINELPFKERLEMFVNSKKPSYDGHSPKVVEEMKAIFGPRPMHPEVPIVLREDVFRKTKDLDDLKQLLHQPVKYDWKRAAPSLDNYRPRNLLGTAFNPLVGTGVFVGAMGGKAYDEYNKQKALIAQREELREKTAALKLPKLKVPSPKANPKKAPLLPKQVKRVGMLGAGAGVLGYTGVKGVQKYDEGVDLAARLKSQGIAAKTPAELKKERKRLMARTATITDEGKEPHMKTAIEKYEMLQKEAGVKDSVKKGIDHLKGTHVKRLEKGVEDSIQLGDNPAVQEIIKEQLKDAKKGRNVARAIAGGAGAAGAAGGGVALHESAKEKTAFEKYEALQKVALNLGGLKSGVDDAVKGVKQTFNKAKGDDVKKWQAGRQKMVDQAANSHTLERYDKRIADATGDMVKARKQVGIAAGGVAAGGAGAAAVGKAVHDKKQEKTALEKYEALLKEAGIGSAVKNGVKQLSGKNVKTQQKMLNDAVKNGDGIGTLQALEGRLMDAKKSRNIARGAAGGGVVAGTAGTAGGVMAAKSGEQEKVAKDVSVEDSQYALDHPYKKSIKEGAGYGAAAAIPFGALAGGALGYKPGSLRTTAGGAGIGALAGGALGSLAGASLGTTLGFYRDQANEALVEDGDGGKRGAVSGALFGGGMSALNSAGLLRVSPAAYAGSVGTGALMNAGLGHLVGQNQERHFNNVHNGDFATNTGLEMAERRNQGHEQVAETESVEIEKAAEEVINDLFKEASAVIAGDEMEKVAEVQNPMAKITGATFGYDRLK